MQPLPSSLRESTFSSRTQAMLDRRKKPSPERAATYLDARTGGFTGDINFQGHIDGLDKPTVNIGPKERYVQTTLDEPFLRRPPEPEYRIQQLNPSFEFDYDRFVYKALRIKYKYTLQHVHDQLCKITTKCITSQELSRDNELHFHALIEIPILQSGAENRIWLAKFKEHFPELHGSAHFYCRPLVTERYLNYTVKDGTFLNNGFDPIVVSNSQLCSYKRFHKMEYFEKECEIRNRYMRCEITLHECARLCVILCGQYNMTRAFKQRAMIERIGSWRIHKEPEAFDNYINSIVMGVNLYCEDHHQWRDPRLNIGD